MLVQGPCRGRAPVVARAPRDRRLSWQGGRADLAIDGALSTSGETLAVSLSDDEFGTVEAIRRLLGYYRHSDRTHLHLTPAAVGQRAIGHFAFFHSRFEHSLWPIALLWLRHGRLPPRPEGEVWHLPADAGQRDRASSTSA